MAFLARGSVWLTTATNASLVMTSMATPSGIPVPRPTTAMSMRPVCSASTRSSVLATVRLMSTPGDRRETPASVPARSSSSAGIEVTVPIATRPRVSPTSSSTANRIPGDGGEGGPGIREHRRRLLRSPAPVRPERSNRSWPSSRSSRRIWALTPGWATWTLSAARVKFASSTTATKYSSWRSSISSDSTKPVLIDLGLLETKAPQW